MTPTSNRCRACDLTARSLTRLAGGRGKASPLACSCTRPRPSVFEAWLVSPSVRHQWLIRSSSNCKAWPSSDPIPRPSCQSSSGRLPMCGRPSVTMYLARQTQKICASSLPKHGISNSGSYRTTWRLLRGGHRWSCDWANEKISTSQGARSPGPFVCSSQLRKRWLEPACPQHLHLPSCRRVSTQHPKSNLCASGALRTRLSLPSTWLKITPVAGKSSMRGVHHRSSIVSGSPIFLVDTATGVVLCYSSLNEIVRRGWRTAEDVFNDDRFAAEARRLAAEFGPSDGAQLAADSIEQLLSPKRSMEVGALAGHAHTIPSESTRRPLRSPS